MLKYNLDLLHSTLLTIYTWLKQRLDINTYRWTSKSGPKMLAICAVDPNNGYLVSGHSNNGLNSHASVGGLS